MNPSEETPLWNELKRLRGRLEYLQDRHAAAIEDIRDNLLALEAKLESSSPPELKSTVRPSAKPAAAPPVSVRTEEAGIAKKEESPQSPGLPQPVSVIAAKPSQPFEQNIAIEPERPGVKAENPAKDSSLELDFGKIWFVRIGIVMLLTGLVFLGNYAYQNWIREMPNGVRLAALFVCAITLLETGRRLAAKENLSKFGEVLLAGGMAFFYYCTFASHHVEKLRIIDSPVLAGILLFAAAAGIAAVSWLRNAKTTAVLGIVLASYSTMLQPIGWMTCISNFLLAGIGLAFMLRPSWSGPGWASMLGSYGAFAGWQLLGASDGLQARTGDPAMLWFLPPVWLMFAIPGVLDRFRESLSERARAWFTGANNALFLLIFSAVWLNQNNDIHYWKVAAVFGSALVVLGIFGRRQNATAGGVNISQGLTVATLAVILKLDGYHLGLALGIESMLLAGASLKFRGRSEAVFSLLCGVYSTAILLYYYGLLAVGFASRSVTIPAWSSALTAFCIVLASFITIRLSGVAWFQKFARISACLLFICASVITSYLCRFVLDDAWSLLATIGLASTLSVGSLKLDPQRKQPEIRLGSLWFLCLAFYVGSNSTNLPGLIISAGLSLAVCWFWHRRENPEEEKKASSKSPEIHAWAFAIAVPSFYSFIVNSFSLASSRELLVIQAGMFGLAAIATLLKCSKLAPSSAVASFLALMVILGYEPEGYQLLFSSTLLNLLAAGLLASPWAKTRILLPMRAPAGAIFRISAFITYCYGWHEFMPGSWFDWLAITSVILTVISLFLKRKLFLESVALIVVALFSLGLATISQPWHASDASESWRGLAVVLALLALILTYRQRPALIEKEEERETAISILSALACAVTTIWATQMLVWRFGWKPAVVLWTLLGFFFISSGLWQRLWVLRISGFALLILTFMKLFAVDVWDFNAFMRVVSFIVLGAALILLGLFYNKFALAIKTLLDDGK